MSPRVLIPSLALLILATPFPLIAGQTAEEYEIGGPLAGVKLPLFPTQHGEPPGYPGCLPDPAQPGKLAYDTEGLSPELHLHPESVEHWRANDFKYLPVRSLFDRQSLLRNWKADDLARLAGVPTEEYAEPLYWVRRHADPVRLDVKNRPVPVVRCRAGTPGFALDCGTLDRGMYVISVVGAVETSQLSIHRKPLYLWMSVNDGVQGEVNHYRLRLGYCDQFYSVAEVYFHAPSRRNYLIQLRVGEGSLVDLLVHNVELHDVLAGRLRRPIKTRMTLHDPAGIAATDPATILPQPERWARDALIWNNGVPLNAAYGTGGPAGKDDRGPHAILGADGRTAQEIEAEFGRWEPGTGDVLAVNAKLGLRYTLADYLTARPLPDPYPFKDVGPGLWFPPPKEGELPLNWFPLAMVIQQRMMRPLAGLPYPYGLGQAISAWVQKGDMRAGRDASVALIRFAYDAPGQVPAQSLGAVLTQPAAYGKDHRCRHRRVGGFSEQYIQWYDQLFPLLSTDADLAASVGRFVPWVREPKDVIELLDVYLVQERVKRYLRYHGVDANNPALLAGIAAIYGEQHNVTDPWLEWVFNRTWVYPLSVSGLPDMITSAFDRDGMKYIGSYYYAQVEEASKNGELMETYIAAGGNPRFDLRDPVRYPKVQAACYWFLRSRIAGLYFPRIGDVTGPSAGYGHWLDLMESPMRRGWRWTKDPQFAWMLKHVFGRKDMSDAEWADVEAAAARQQRAPWLENRSRVLPAWFGVLESGVEHDDFRFRRAVFLRIGQGWGHGHADTLDLQFYMHGLPMTLDGGARPGYSTPPDISSFVHNLVEVDEKNWWGHSWVTALSDTPGARYLAAEATPPRSHPNVRLYRRQVSLVDVDEGHGSRPLTPAEVLPGFRGLDPNAVTPNSYIFDVVRVAGGKVHTYCFHGPCYDETTVNLPARTPLDGLTDAEKHYLRKCVKTERIFGGDAPDTVVATWRYPRAPESNQSSGNEQQLARTRWSDDLPRKYTRLHLLGQKGARALVAPYYCRAGDYGFDNLFVQHRAEAETERAFVAVIEPYAGEPFLTSVKLLDVADNEGDALRAVAVEVQPKLRFGEPAGRIDICFADGRPGKIRQFKIQNADCKVAGEFGYYSADADGPRQVTLTGGTVFQTPHVTLRPAARERRAQVVRVDYAAKSLTLDTAWPGGALLRNRVLEVGVPGHMTTYTIADATLEGRNTIVRVNGGADFYLGRVREVDAANRTVYAGMGLPFLEGAPSPGVDRHWVASNEEQTKFWRADYLGGDRAANRYAFRLDGPVTPEDFGRTGALRLWEYGAGDSVRQSTFASLRRVAPGEYELVADVDVEITLGGVTRQVTAAELAKNGGAVRLRAGK